MPKTKAIAKQAYDSPWKKVLVKFFRPALELCFPHIAGDINWNKKVEYLDKEFEQIVRQAELGALRVDKLVKVWRKNGQEQWVLLHLEVQAQREVNLGRRIFDYYSRICQRYNRDAASAVILADAHPRWRPSTYEHELWGCRIRLDFPTVKLLDLAADAAGLLANPNPFAIVVLAQVQAVQAKADAGQRFFWKKRLIRLGYERGYSREQILDLFEFIDWVIVLPEMLEEKFGVEHAAFERAQRMEYITSIERRGIEKGRSEGRTEGQQEALRESIVAVLEARFKEVPYPVVEALKELNDLARLKALLRKASTISSLPAFLKALPR